MVKQNFLRTIFFSVLSVFLFAGAGCTFSLGGSSTSNSNADGRTIPVYQGMTVSSTSTVNQRISYANEIDQDNPFNETEENQIEAKLDTILGADVIDEDFAYFAQASELVRVTINILNPDSFVILSFNLNGRRYQSYEFREGSDSTRLLMDVQLAADVGVQELTLDEIKYVDGSDIKDAILAGETTVKVGVLYPNLPEITVSEKTIGTTSLGLDINVTDVNGLIEGAPKPLYAFLYDGQEIIQEELAIGANAIDFTKLHSKTIYQYAIATIFDLLDGNGNVVRIFAKEALRTNAFLSMTLGATKTEITFDITADDSASIGHIESVELYHGETLKETVVDQNTGTFSRLFTNNAYLVKAHFSYQFEAEGEVFEEVEEQIVTTQANAVPILSFTDVVPGQEDIVFEYLVTDVDSVGSLTKIELIHNSVVVKTMTTYDSTMFEGLLSNNDYQLKATYMYDLNDGVGEHTLEVTENVKTLAKATPIVVVNNVVRTQTSIGFRITVTDLDQTGAVSAIELYKNDRLIEALSNLSLREFTGLLSNSEYTLKAIYTYDLNDGLGAQALTESFEIRTLPQDISISNISILNQQITSGDTVLFVVNVVNPDNVIVNSVIVDGIEILLDPTSSTTKLRFRFAITDEMGIANYFIEGFVFNDGDVMDISDNNSIEFFVMANLYIESVIQADGNLYGNMYDNYRITLNQPIATYISEVTANGVNPTIQVVKLDKIIVIDDYTIKIPITSFYNVGVRDFRIVSIQFVVDSVTYNTNVDFLFSIYIVNSQISYIEKVSDLLSMVDDCRMYILNGDIDFFGVNWSPINFNGVLLGNGHKFTNITIIDYSSTQRNDFSIFGSINGVISNLVIEDIFISIDKSNSVKVSGLAITNTGTINNVIITGNIEINSTGESQIGGIVAYNYGNILNSHFSGIIDVNLITNENYMLYVGGIAGYSSGANISSSSARSLIIVNSVSLDCAMIGGIVGRNQDNSTLTNVLSNSVINVSTDIPSNTTYVGGLIGYNYDSSVYNSISIGEINIYSYSSYVAVGGISGGVMWGNYYSSISFVYNIDKLTLIGMKSDTDVIENCYIYDVYALHDMEKISIIELNDKYFFISTLGWSESYWTFENLDFLNEAYPELVQSVS